MADFEIPASARPTDPQVARGRCPVALSLPPDVPCQRPAGHRGAHKNGLLFWHDPPLVLVDGQELDLTTDSDAWVDGQVLLAHEREPELRL